MTSATDMATIGPRAASKARLEPAAIAGKKRRLACPICGSSVFVEKLGPRNGNRAFQAECSDLDCTYRQTVVVFPDGTAVNAEDPVEAADNQVKKPLRGRRMTPKVRPLCKMPGCKRQCEEAGLCASHFSLWYIAGRPPGVDGWAQQEGAREKQQRGGKTGSPSRAASCRYPGCSERSRLKGLCHSHAAQWLREDRPPMKVFLIGPGVPARRDSTRAPEEEPPPVNTCQVAGCELPVKARDLCSTHHQRWLIAGRPLAVGLDEWLEGQRHRPIKHRGADGSAGDGGSDAPSTRNGKDRVMKICLVEGCERTRAAQGLCSSHHSRWTRQGTPRGKAMIRWIAEQKDQPFGHPRRPSPRAGTGDASGRSPPEPQSPSDAPPHPIAPVTFQPVKLPANVHRVLIGRIGQQLTITDPSGAVLWQMPV